MRREQLRNLLRFVFHLISRIEVSGLENLPAQGGCLLATNHLSRIDAPLVFMLLDRQDATGLVADKYQHKPFFRWLVQQVDGIWINRESADFRALKTATAYLQAGGMLGISPEGTRSPTGALQAAKTGAAYLADRAGTPVLPIGVWGTEDAVHNLLHLRRSNIHVRFGLPFSLPPVERRQREADLQRNTEEIMCQIAALIPAQYHGIYAGHPRLLALLDGRAAAVPAPSVLSG